MGSAVAAAVVSVVATSAEVVSAARAKQNRGGRVVCIRMLVFAGLSAGLAERYTQVGIHRGVNTRAHTRVCTHAQSHTERESEPRTHMHTHTDTAREMFGIQ